MPQPDSCGAARMLTRVSVLAHENSSKTRGRLGTPVAVSKWTPLLALANACRYPDPPRDIDNTIEDLDWAQERIKVIPQQFLDERRDAQLAILRLLLSHKCKLNIHDGYGATPLFAAISNHHEAFVLTLLEYEPDVNTKTESYIDGPGDITPLHEACWSTRITTKLLELGADPDATTTDGDTPETWAALWKIYTGHSRITFAITLRCRRAHLRTESAARDSNVVIHFLDAA